MLGGVPGSLNLYNMISYMAIPGIKSSNPSLISILNVVCESYGVDVNVVSGKSRGWTLLRPRMVYCYLAKKHTGELLNDVGSLINRHYSTVCYNHKTISDELRYDKELQQIVANLETQLFGLNTIKDS